MNTVSISLLLNRLKKLGDTFTFEQVASVVSELSCIEEYDIECMEWQQEHLAIERVKFFDYNNKEITDIYSEEENYDKNDKVIVPDVECVEVLKEFSKFTGFCAYSDITDVGEWVYDKKDNHFIKIN